MAALRLPLGAQWGSLGTHRVNRIGYEVCMHGTPWRSASKMPSLSGYVRPALIGGGYLVGYVLLDWASYFQPVLRLGITPWNPQAGLTLALIISGGSRYAGLTILAALLSEIIVRGTPGPIPVLIFASSIIALGYAVLGHILHPGRLYTAIESPRGMLWLFAASTAITFMIAVGYVTTFVTFHLVPDSEIFRSTRRYWLGDLSGILTLTPLMLLLPRWRLALADIRARHWEVIAQLLAVTFALWIIFGLGTTGDVRLFYLLFLPVIWIAFRWGVAGTVLCTLAIQLLLVSTARDEAHYPPVIDLQLLMITLAATGLLLGAVVTERAAALQKVAAREAEQRAILRTAPDGVISTDASGRIISANRAAEQLFQLRESELIGRPLEDRFPTLHAQSVQGLESLKALRADGSMFPADVTWSPFEAPASGRILVIRDATDRLAQESKLRERDAALARATRFAMLGEVASALAHELNQPTTALVSYLRAAQILAAPIDRQDPRLIQTLDKAALEALRAADVLRKLRDFYRGGVTKLEAVNIQEVIKSTLARDEEALKSMGVVVDTRFDAELPEIFSDRTQLEMILLNVLNNAIDAVAHCPISERKICLTTTHCGPNVVVAIEDSGPGVAPEVETRLFDPFVTTKADGMGLGLAISRSLLRSQGGEVSVARGALGGALFYLRIPTEPTQQVSL